MSRTSEKLSCLNDEMNEKKRVGIMGGTFNPIHNGHIAIAAAAQKACGLDFVVFMPNGYPAYKKKPAISDEDRENMVRCAIKDYADFIYSDFEIAQHDVTYTARTLPAFKNLHPDWEIFYIVGSDSLCYMDQWYHPEIIFSEAVIVAACRDTESTQETERYREFLMERYHADIRLVYNEVVPVSSTKIREAIMHHEPFEHLLPEAVTQYIKDRGLYHGE